ncbi:MAG: isocitrate/isopropylmalate dehydrogenase family protein, partial [Promethearchaeota archaeon]
MEEPIERAKKHFEQLIREQLERVERLKKAEDWIDYSQLKPIIIGIVGGDGIGPYITKHAQKVLEF